MNIVKIWGRVCEYFELSSLWTKRILMRQVIQVY
jgi:hypothetical protein